MDKDTLLDMLGLKGVGITIDPRSLRKWVSEYEMCDAASAQLPDGPLKDKADALLKQFKAALWPSGGLAGINEPALAAIAEELRLVLRSACGAATDTARC